MPPPPPPAPPAVQREGRLLGRVGLNFACGVAAVAGVLNAAFSTQVREQWNTDLVVSAAFGAALGGFIIAFVVGWLLSAAGRALRGRSRAVQRTLFAIGAVGIIFLSAGGQATRSERAVRSVAVVSSDLVVALKNRNASHNMTMAELGLDDVLRPEQLTDPARLRDALPRLDQARALAEDHERQTQAILERAAGQFRNAPVPSDRQEEYLRLVNEGMDQIAQDLIAYARLERSYVETVADLLTYLEPRSGTFRAADGGTTIEFATEEDLRTYNDAPARIQEIADEQEAIAERSKLQYQDFLIRLEAHLRYAPR